MSLNATIGLNAETLSAINNLAEAIRVLAGASASALSDHTAVRAIESSAAANAAAAEVPTGPIYWADNSTGEFGKVENEAAYKSRKLSAPGVYKITESVYDTKVAELREKNEATAKATKEAREAKAAAKAAKAAADKQAADAAAAEAADATAAATETKTKAATSAAPASRDDLLAAFQAYLPENLEKPERAERQRFVKALLTRFGADRVRNLDEEHFALAINLVQRKILGEEIDPESASFADVAPHFAEEEDDLV